jgi:ribosomal protein S18 acetylase RimI-like enzyme
MTFEAKTTTASKSEVFALFEHMGGYHPAEPHWYLPLIGIDPACQGQGHGSALLRHGLAHGFEVLDTIQLGSSPPIFPMLRPAR